MTMFSSLTPAARRALRVPSSRAEMMRVFQRAWMIPMRREEPMVTYVVSDTYPDTRHWGGLVMAGGVLTIISPRLADTLNARHDFRLSDAVYV
jgi:hypothetical protein